VTHEQKVALGRLLTWACKRSPKFAGWMLTHLSLRHLDYVCMCMNKAEWADHRKELAR